MILRFIIAIVLVALVGGGLVGFNLFRDRMIADFFANMPVQPATVSATTLEAETWQPTIETIGTVNAAQGVELTVEAGGIVREIAFTSNAEVEAGELLVRLDDAVQQADVDAARTRLALDEQDLARARDLQSRGAGTEVNVSNAEAAARSSEAQLARAVAVLEQRRLVAPFSGTIGLPRIDLGQYITPGTIVATLQDLDTMRVDFTLPEQRLPDVAIGQPIRVSGEGVSGEMTGEIVGIDPRVDPASRLFAVRGAVSNEAGGLTPGQFVRIAIVLPQEEGVVAVPQTALVSSLYGDYVFRIVPAEEGEGLALDQVFVQPGRRAGGLIEIVSGLAPGERIVTAGQNRLSNNMPVVIDGAGEASETAPTSETAPAAESAAR
ncbi:efflux RND transporter periplasmic adaptor subunit [Salinarimonas ramus]|uniref:MexH family multidrug efflux RND transporter periplasmic adaptor subunit n=1 Tax=Salinarimonas ramus TaxID=690164 RepID=A0A917Q5H2_9HYPH|nr:efflux RND transporter periplasmic adaptor subunit [Salinarimonas ramus]GGK29172.1 MexH family multidrug efflux RND transporter periplasmic adaptor subunit [Salinarimonas ramus]